MKQLTCEMCGSTDIIKQDGVFMCQTCGTKYSVEEAKKMMIEGTVDVSGTVKVDKSVELDNLLILAERALKEGNYESAESYYDNILRMDPDNWRANFYKSYCFTMHSKIIDLLGNYITTLNTAISTEKMLLQRESIDFAACSDIIFSISELVEVCFINKYNIYNKNPEYISYTNGTTINHNMGGYKKLQQECAKIVDNAIAFYSFCYSVEKANDSFLMSTEKALTRLKDDYAAIPKAPYEKTLFYGKEHTDLCKTNYNIQEIIEKNIKEVREKLSDIAVEEARIAREKAVQIAEEQRAKNEAYWAEHAEEKHQLESERDRLCAELKELESQLIPFESEINTLRDKRDGKVPSEETKDTILTEISNLRKEQAQLGIFKSKEKKTLQNQINELNVRLSSINESIETERKEQQRECNVKIRDVEERAKPIKNNIITIKNRIVEIKTELTKNR